MVDTVVVQVPPPVSVTVEVPPPRETLTVDIGRKGDKGNPGESAYATAIAGGFVGTEAEWLASLVGATGDAATIISATVSGLAAGSSPTVTLGGTPSERSFAFGIPAGDKGDPGNDSVVPGPANTLAIGTVGEGAAAAVITGTAPNQTLNLTIPRGNPGSNSTVPGPANTLAIGSVSEGPAAATITGAAPDQTLNLTIPKGDPGSPGAPNSLSVGTVTEGAAAATITGTAPSQTLNLVIPKGDPGADGASLLLIDGGTSADPYGGSVIIDGGTS